MVASLTCDSFPVPVLRALFICAALAAGAGCEAKRSSDAFRSEGSDRGTRAENQKIRAAGLADDSLNVDPASLADPRNDPVLWTGL